MTLDPEESKSFGCHQEAVAESFAIVIVLLLQQREIKEREVGSVAVHGHDCTRVLLASADEVF